MAQSSQNVRNIFKKFQRTSKFSGMCCFRYPSDKFKISISGLFFAAFYSISLVLMFIRSVQSLAAKLKRKASVVYLFGLTVIEIKNIIAAASCNLDKLFAEKKDFQGVENVREI